MNSDKQINAINEGLERGICGEYQIVRANGRERDTERKEECSSKQSIC